MTFIRNHVSRDDIWIVNKTLGNDIEASIIQIDQILVIWMLLQTGYGVTMTQCIQA